MVKIKAAVHSIPFIYEYLREIKYIYDYKTNKKAIKKSPRKFVCDFFYKHNHYELPLDTPVTFNEKLQWLKLYWKDSQTTQLVDKYAVRSHIQAKGYSGILNEIYGIYNNANDIELESLPASFILKPTHDSGHAVVCKDKKDFNWNKYKRRLNRWLKFNYAFMSGEYPYYQVNPGIVCEKLLIDRYREELVDYRFYCFDGEPYMIQVDMDYSVDHTRNFYSLEWKQLNIKETHPNKNNEDVLKPEKLDEMIKISRDLSDGFPFVRVDFFYTIAQDIIFAEMTFFPKGGTNHFLPEKVDQELGHLIKLPDKNNTWDYLLSVEAEK